MNFKKELGKIPDCVMYTDRLVCLNDIVIVTICKLNIR